MGEGRIGSSGASRQRGRFFFLVVVAAVATALALPSGCGLDDSAVAAFDAMDGSLVGDGLAKDETGANPSDGAADVITCTPKTCANYPSVCRSGLDDGCGALLDCTTACQGGYACIPASGTCDGPPICRDAGAPGGNCHTIVNPGNLLEAGCGECGNPGYSCVTSTCTCAGGPVCGANCCNTAAAPNCNGTNNSCCKLNTCAAGTCNPVNNNGCGGNLDCSANCGSGGMQCGTDHVCATPPTCTNKGANNGSCGLVAGTHGLTIDCGTCASAGYSCVSNVCSCTAEAMTVTCANKCGTVNNNCGTPIDCGTCESGQVCTGSANCTCHTQSCTPGQACCGPNGAHFCNPGGLPCP